MSSIPGLPTRGSNVTVVITRVHLHPLCMFVEFWGKFNNERTEDYKSLAKDIQLPGYTFQEFEGNPCDQCLTQINGTWYRCRIVSRNGSKYNVYLFDKGMTFSTTSSKLSWGKKEHFHLPPEVEFCVLANVLPLSPENRWSPVALEFLRSLCDKSVKAHVQDVLVPQKMFLLHIPCISTQMYQMGFAKKLSPDRFQDFVLLSLQSRSGAQVSPETQFLSTREGEPLHKKELFMYPELSAGTVETVLVTEVTDPQQVYCQLKVFSQELKKISEQLKKCCEDRMTSCIVGPEMIDFPCAAKGSDGRWYRSVLKQVFPASSVVEVLNVDYGTKQFVQVENLRPLAGEFFRMPVVTYTCSLHGITDKGVGWTSSQIDFLRNLLLCKTVIAKFEYQSITEGLHYVTLYGDENTNINNLFGSKESCLLECEKKLEDYNIRSFAYSRQSTSLQEKNQSLAVRSAEDKEGKGLSERLPVEELSLNASNMAKVQHVSIIAERDETQRPLKAKMSMQPVILPPTHLPDGGQSGVYRNNGMPFLPNTVGFSSNKSILPTFKEHMFPIGSVLDVSVSHVESPNDFWCQLVQTAAHLKLLMHDIQARYAGTTFQTFVETACVARHPDNGMWYRALAIHKHETPHVDVLFVDYGQTETVSLYDLRRICPEFLTLQGQAFRCSLLNPVDPTSAVNEWSDEATARFLNFVDTAASNLVILKCTIYAVMYSEQKIVFNIVDLETPFESVCTSMTNLVKGAPSTKASGPSFRLDTYYYSTHNVKVGTEEQMTVTCVNNVGQFYCQLERNADVMQDLKIKVSKLCCQLENVKLPSGFGTLCFAKYTDGEWYRGQIKATKPAILVHFVDYGDTIEVNKSDLLPVPREASDIMSVPVQAVVCSLSDVPNNVPSEVNGWFETSATDCKFQALVVAREPDGKLLVELYHGNTQINSKIKKMFQIEIQKMPIVCQSWKTPETHFKHAQKTPKATSKHDMEMEDPSKIVQSSFSAPKPAHVRRDEPEPAHMDLQSAPKHKVKAAPLQLYRTPHQRQSGGRIQSNMVSGLEGFVEPEKESFPKDTEELIKSKSPDAGPHKGVNIGKLPKVEDLPAKSVTSGMEADVYISHCNSPLSFYVQLIKEEDEIFSIAEKLNGSKPTLKTSDLKDLNPGDLVQAEFSDDSSLYRAVVQEIHANTMALVEFVDFGNTAMTPISKMHRLDKFFLELPVYSIHCMLSSVVNLNKEEVCDPDVVSAFKKDIGDNGEKVLKCRFIRQTGSQWEVSLKDNDVNVTCKVDSESSTNPFESTSETDEQLDHHTIPVPDGLSPPHYHQQQILEGQQLEVYITSINAAETIWCQCSDSEQLDNITLTISDVVAAGNCKSVSLGALCPGSPCLALFSDDNLWYRAEVITKDGDDLCVLFVDYGNMSQVNIADVRGIPIDLEETPPQALLCELDGFDSSCGSWSSHGVKELTEITTDKLVQLTVNRVERTDRRIKCFVQMECDGQSVNEAMTTWWNSSTTETEPEPYKPLQCDLAVKEPVLLETQLECPGSQGEAVACNNSQSDDNEEQFSDVVVEWCTAEEVKQRSSKISETTTDADFESFAESPKEGKDQNSLEESSGVGVPIMLIHQTESKDILLCDSGIEETITSPLDDKGIFTLSFDNVGETDEGHEVEGASAMDTVKSEDLMSSLHETLKYATDVSEQQTDLKKSWEDVGCSVDVMIYLGPGHDQDVTEMVVRESSGTSVTTVTMVARETVFPRKSTDLRVTSKTKMTSKDLKQIEAACTFPSTALPEQQLCDAPTDQYTEGGDDDSQEETCDSIVAEASDLFQIDLRNKETAAHHEVPDSDDNLWYQAEVINLFTDTDADESEERTLLSADTVNEVEAVTCALEEDCSTDVCSGIKEQSDDEVTSEGEETVLNQSLASLEHSMEFREVCLQEETLSNTSYSVTEDETSVADEEELSYLPCDTELDMRSLVEQVTCLVGEICLTGCTDPHERESAVQTPPQQKEDFDNGVLLKRTSSPDDSFEAQLPKITHLSLVIRDGSADVLTVKQQPEE